MSISPKELSPSPDLLIELEPEDLIRQQPATLAIDPLCTLFALPGLTDSAVAFSKVQSVARDEGFTVRKENSKAASFYVVCTRSGEHKDSHRYMETGGRLRKNSDVKTKKCNCPWKLRVFKNKWTNHLWRIEAKQIGHNHPLSGSAYAFAQHRRLTDTERGVVITALQAHAPAPAIVDILLQKASDEGRQSHTSIKEIYNVKSQMKSVALQGRTPSDAIIRELAKKGIPNRYFLNPNKELQYLMRTSPLAIVLSKYYGYVLFIDATYKTNRYGMPLLHIIGMSPTNLSFTVALCFLAGKNQADYHWALSALLELVPNLPTEVVLTDQCTALRNALREVLPNWKQQLCTWHLGENLNKNHRGKIPAEDFERIKQAANQLRAEPLKRVYEALKENYSDEFLRGDAKVRDAWLYVLSQHDEGDHFLAHQLTTTLNFGESATSRCESFHRAVKRTIAGANSDIFSAVHATLIHMRGIHRKIFMIHSTDTTYRVKSHPPCMQTVSFA